MEGNRNDSGVVRNDTHFWDLYKDEHDNLNKDAHYQSKAAKIFFLYLTPVLLTGAMALSVYGLTQGISHHNVATISGSSVGLAVTLVTIAGCIFLFLHLKKGHEEARNKQSNLERTEIISDESVRRVALMQDRAKRSEFLKKLSDNQIEAFIRGAKCALVDVEQAKKNVRDHHEVWHSFIVELLSVARGAVVSDYIRENADPEGKLFISTDDRKKIYEEQLKKPKLTRADADVLLNRMRTDVVERGASQEFPKEGYRQLFIDYAKKVSFPTFVEYFCDKPQNLSFEYSAKEMEQAFLVQKGYPGDVGSAWPTHETIHKFVLAAHAHKKSLPSLKENKDLKASYKKCIDYTLHDVTIQFRTKNEGTRENCYFSRRNEQGHVTDQKIYLLDPHQKPEKIKELFESLSDEKRDAFIAEFTADGTPLVNAHPEFRALVYKNMTPGQIVEYVQRMHYDSLGRDYIAEIDREVLASAGSETLKAMLEQLRRSGGGNTPFTAIFMGMLLNRLIDKDFGGKLDTIATYYPYVAEIHQGLCVREFMRNKHIEDRVTGLWGRTFKDQEVVLQQQDDNEKKIRSLVTHLKTMMEKLKAAEEAEASKAKGDDHKPESFLQRTFRRKG